MAPLGGVVCPPPIRKVLNAAGRFCAIFSGDDKTVAIAGRKRKHGGKPPKVGRSWLRALRRPCWATWIRVQRLGGGCLWPRD